MRRSANKLLSTITALGLALTGTAAWAQYDGPQQAPEPPGPNRGVARISVISGDVSVRRGDANEFVAAAINAPLVASDTILTGEGSRAEVQFDYSNMLRLAPLSEARMAELDYHRYQVQIGRGTALFRVLRNRDAEVELSTPSVSIRPVKSGAFRVSVLPDGSTEITVRAGEAEIFTPRGSERIHAGRTMLARGNPSDPEFQYVGARGPDDFDYWSERRDQDMQRSRAYQYVPTDVYGADDLDRYGQWENTPEYGMVWVPYTSTPDWAPYRYGRWSWVDYYGWSWVSYDPWGWAPYHYGRWFYRANHWCWYPGGFHSRHYWSPALVAFFGFGNVGVGIGFGNIGWVPLAPYEAFHPWWGSHYYGGYRSGYVDRSVTIVNNVNITNVYRNARYNGVSGVDSRSFGQGRVNSLRVTDADLRTAGQFRGGLPVTPTRDSLRWSDHQAAVPRGGLVTDSQRFYSSRPASQGDRVPFEQQRQAIEQANVRQFGRGMQGDAGVGARGEAVRGSQPAAAVGRGIDSRASGAAVENGYRRGDSRFGDPGQGRGDQPAARGESGNSGGWRRFGDPGQSRGTVAPVSPQSSYRGGDQPAVRGESSNGGAGWRRFGGGDSGAGASPRVESSPRMDSGGGSYSRGGSDQPASRGDSGGGSVWRRGGGESPSYSAPAPRGDSGAGIGRYEGPRAAPSYDRGGGGFGRSESPRMQSAPIVRERQSAPAPRMEAPRGGGGGGRGEGPARSEGGRSGGERGGRGR